MATEHKDKPKRQKTGGRQKGTPNKVTTEVRSMFQKHGVELVRRLMTLSRSANKEIALRATAEALNRGYGKPPVALDIVQRDADAMTDIDFARRFMFYLFLQVKAAVDEHPELRAVPRDVLLRIALDQAFENPSVLGAENESPAAPGVLGVDDDLSAENSAPSPESLTPTPETPALPEESTAEPGLLGKIVRPGGERERDQ